MGVSVGLDIGTKNFSLCSRDVETGSVLKWQCVELGSPQTPVSSLVRNLCLVLEDFVTGPDVQLRIERQPPFARNVSQVLMGAIAGWAEANNVKWDLVTPVQKGGTYRERKAQAVKTVRSDLVARKDDTFLGWFNALSKKDDAADSYHLAGTALEK